MFKKLFFLLAIIATAVNGFAVSSLNGGSSFAATQRVSVTPIVVAPTRKGDMQMMGGKKAKFGIFSPAVYVAKIALGEKKLNKIRGKGIGLHSGVIGDFTKWSGSYHLRVPLVRLAKSNGDILGFLV